MARSEAATQRTPELLAPAGDFAALRAALEAGADAVYFGLGSLNARRYARNFTPTELSEAVAEVHARGAKAYLTLNIDLAERELGRAARSLAWAAASGIDGVLLRDPALLALRDSFPGVALHFSTQNGITNSADVAAAGALGAARVVVAREMSLAEIRAAAAVGVPVEVFVQGALCFSVSGRCLLSSWVGGRSGNRGACTSSCRVPWSAEGEPIGTPFSMRDLSALRRLDALRAAGVAALKIEGRMKAADWVRQAVSIYRRALDGADPNTLADEARRLGAYTGRLLTDGFLDARREELTGVSGRLAANAPAGATGGIVSGDGLAPASDVAGGPDASCDAGDSSDGDEPAYDVRIDVTAAGIEVECSCGSYTERWTLPKTVVRRPEKAITLGQFLTWQAEQAVDGSRAETLATNQGEFLIVPRAANALAARIAAAVRRGRKQPDALQSVELPPVARAILEKSEPSGANRMCLGDEPDRARLEAAQLVRLRRPLPVQAVIVEGATARSLDRLRRAAGKASLVVALPAVFFEEEIARIESLLAACKREGLVVEVNSWGGWLLARKLGARMEGGPGLAVLNSLAAAQLARLGLRSVTYSLEADRRKLEELSAHCPAAASLVVFGRPPLWTTRAALAENVFDGQVLTDRRDVRIMGRRRRGLWVFRPVEPFDWRDLRNERIRAAHLVVDLVGSPDPIAEFHGAAETDRPPRRFNYDRVLK